MTHLQAFVRFTDGTGRVERADRNDARGRATLDRWAFTRLQDRGVARIDVQTVDRIATRGGTYR